MIALLACAVALAGELDALLARGELTLAETREDGHLRQVTTISDVAAPREAVWDRLAAFEDYVNWMPQVARSDVVARDETGVTVDWSIKVPGPNVIFVARYTLDKANWRIDGTWVSGSLEGSHWEWRLEERPGGGTRLYRTVFTNVVGDNWLIRQFDDDWHTLEVGLNSATGVIESKGIKRAMR